MYKFIISHIKRNKIKVFGILECRPRSFGILQTYCKIHAILFIKKNMSKYFRYLKKKCLNNFRIFSHMQEKKEKN